MIKYTFKLQEADTLLLKIKQAGGRLPYSAMNKEEKRMLEPLIYCGYVTTGFNTELIEDVAGLTENGIIITSNGGIKAVVEFENNWKFYKTVFYSSILISIALYIFAAIIAPTKEEIANLWFIEWLLADCIYFPIFIVPSAVVGILLCTLFIRDLGQSALPSFDNGFFLYFGLGNTMISAAIFILALLLQIAILPWGIMLLSSLIMSLVSYKISVAIHNHPCEYKHLEKFSKTSLL